MSLVLQPDVKPAPAPGVIPQSLRESTVVKALAAYASISWLMLQVVSTFVSGLGLPDWVFTGFLWILIAGLPVLFFATRVRNSVQKADSPGFNLGGLNLRRAAVGGGLMIGLWVALVGAFMASWAFGIGPAASLLAAGTLNRSDPVLIAEFDNRTRDPLLASTVTQAIRLDLSQSNLIRIVEDGDLEDALERMDLKPGTKLDRKQSRELAIREGMAGVLEGEVAALGPATLISARLVNPRTGDVMAEYQERAKNADGLLDAVDRLSSTLRNKIGEPLTTLRVEPPLAKVTTASMPALRAYTEANAAHAAGDKDKAITLLRAALSLDSSFPMAWRKLGALLNDDDPLKANEAYTNAFNLRAHLPERERELASGSYYKNVRNDLPQAMAAYRNVLANYPDDEVALNNLANLHTAFQQPLEALKLQQRLIKTKPRFAGYSNLFNSYVRLGRLDDALATHRAAAKLFATQKRIKFQPIILAEAKGDYAAADRLMDQFIEANRDKPDLVNDLFVGRYEWKRGHFERASAIFRERARLAQAKGKPATAIEAMTSVVALAAASGDPARGRAIIADTLSLYPLSSVPEGLRPYVDLAIASALVGDAPAAQRFLAQDAQQGIPDGSLNYDQRRRAQGLIAIAERRFDDAVAILSSASRFGQCSTCLLYDLGVAQEAAGRPADAMETYQRFAQHAPFALARGEMLGPSLARLARLQERSGDLKSAAATRQRLGGLWSGADGGLLAQVEASNRWQAPA